MNFVADEGVSRALVEALRENGHDVFHIAESSRGVADDEILEKANNEDRILITRDKDFGELVYKNKMLHAGIVLNRLHVLSTEKKIEIILNVIDEFGEELKGKFTVIEPGNIRFRII